MELSWDSGGDNSGEKVKVFWQEDVELGTFQVQLQQAIQILVASNKSALAPTCSFVWTSAIAWIIFVTNLRIYITKFFAT
jgi:hypothetical protein